MGLHIGLYALSIECTSIHLSTTKNEKSMAELELEKYRLLKG